MVYQDPGAALNPTTKIGPQVAEAFTVLGQSRKEAEANALRALQGSRSPTPRGGPALSAPALGRDAAAGRHRDRAGLGPEAARPRRADDRARCDGRGERARPRPHRSRPRRMPRSCSSRTTSASSGRCATGSASCTPARSSRRATPRPSSSTPSIRTPSACSARFRAAASARSSGRCRRSRATCPQIGTDLPTCVFVDRCPLADELCRTVVPPIVEVGGGRWTRCHHRDRLDRSSSRRPSRARTRSTATWPCRSRTCPRRSTRAATTCRRWSRSGSSCSTARRSASSANRAPGKSTLAKTILGIESPDAGGSLELDDHALAATSAGRPTADKRSIQMVFQNPDSALNRGWTARRILARSVTKLTGSQGQGGQRAGRQARRRPAADPAPPRPQAAPAVGRAQAARRDRPGVRRRPPRSSSPTSRPARSTCRSRPRSSTCSPSCSSRARRATCSSRTTSASCATWPTGSRSCTSAGSWRSASRRRSSSAQPPVHRGAAVGGPERRRRDTAPASCSRARSRARPTRRRGCVFHTRCPRVIRGLCEVTEPPLIEVEPGHMMSCHIPLEELRGAPARSAESARRWSRRRRRGGRGGGTGRSRAPVAEEGAGGARPMAAPPSDPGPTTPRRSVPRTAERADPESTCPRS